MIKHTLALCGHRILSRGLAVVMNDKDRESRQEKPPTEHKIRKNWPVD